LLYALLRIAQIGKYRLKLLRIGGIESLRGGVANREFIFDSCVNLCRGSGFLLIAGGTARRRRQKTRSAIQFSPQLDVSSRPLPYYYYFQLCDALINSFLPVYYNAFSVHKSYREVL
jgi:hypothetical protein